MSQQLDQLLEDADASRPATWRPFISHFTGCKFCHVQFADEGQKEACLDTFDRLYRFADNQVLEKFRLRRKSVDSEEIEEI